MLAIMKAANKTTSKLTKEQKEAYKPKDIIVTRVSYEEERDKDNNRIIKRIEKRVNLTKKVNETAKAVKVETALDKIALAEKDMLNKGVL